MQPEPLQALSLWVHKAGPKHPPEPDATNRSGSQCLAMARRLWPAHFADQSLVNVQQDRVSCLALFIPSTKLTLDVIRRQRNANEEMQASLCEVSGEWAGAAPEVIVSGRHTCTTGAVCTAGVGSFGVWHRDNALGYTDLSRCRKEDLAETARSQTGSDLSRVRKLPPGNRQTDEAPDPQSFAARPRPSPLRCWRQRRWLGPATNALLGRFGRETLRRDLAFKHANTFGRRILRQRGQTAATLPHEVRGWSFNATTRVAASLRETLLRPFSARTHGKP